MASTYKLDSIPKEQIDKAFKKVKDENKFKEGSLVLVTEEYYTQALDFIQRSFVPDEPIEKALGQEWNDEEAALWKSCLTKNMSLMLINETSGEVIGMRGVTTTKLGDKFDSAKFKDEPIKKLCKLMDDVGDKFDVFGHFGEKEAIHFMILGVAEPYRRRGLATRLMQCGVAFVRYLELGSVVITGEGSSNFSKKVYENNEFEILYEQFYEDYTVNGEKVICNTGDHKSLRVYGKRV